MINQFSTKTEVLEAIKLDWRELVNASEILRNDPDVLRAAAVARALDDSKMVEVHGAEQFPSAASSELGISNSFEEELGASIDWWEELRNDSFDAQQHQPANISSSISVGNTAVSALSMEASVASAGTFPHGGSVFDGLEGILKEEASRTLYNMRHARRSLRHYFAASPALQKNRVFLKEVIKLNPAIIPKVDANLIDDNLVSEALLELGNPQILFYASHTLKTNKDFLVTLRKKTIPNVHPFITRELANDKEFVLTMISYCADEFRSASEILRRDYDVVRAALSQKKCLTRYVTNDALKEAVLHELYPKKAKPRAVFLDPLYNRSPLYKAVANNCLSEVSKLLETENGRQQLKYEITAILLKCLQNRNSDMLILLLTHQPDVSMAANNGQSLIVYAVQNQDIDSVKVLLDYNSNIINEFEQGKGSALGTAVISNDEALCHMLLEYGAMASCGTICDLPYLFFAILNQQFDIARLLLGDDVLGDITQYYLEEQVNVNGEQLHCICQFLIANNVNAENLYFGGASFLHYAITIGQLEIAKLLLEKSPSIINEQNINNLTALDIAVQEANLEAVKLLCGFKAIVEENYRRYVLIYALKGDKPSHAEIVSYLVDYSPVPVTWLFDSDETLYKTVTKLTKFSLTSDLDDSQIEQLPLHIKTVVISADVSTRCLVALENRNIKVILDDDITMYTDQKYMGERLSKVGGMSPIAGMGQSKQTGVYESADKTIISLQRLINFRETTGNEDEVDVKIYTQEMFQFINASSKQALKSEDKIFTVFAYRKNNACLPNVLNNNCRCIIVLTVDEYNNLKISKNSLLVKYFDFLLLNPRKKIDSEQLVKIGKLTERRRAFIFLSAQMDIKTPVNLDDNVLEIALDMANQGCEALYDYMHQEMLRLSEPLVSISTYSRLDRIIQTHQLGSKAWMLNMQQIFEVLPKDCVDALMLYNEECWGEDYFLQIFLHVLFSKSSQSAYGYTILDPNKIQLKRLPSQKSTNARQGMKIKELEPDDILHPTIRARFAKDYPSILEASDKAAFIFNRLARARLKDYVQQKALHHTLDIDEKRKRVSQIKQCQLINLPYTRVSSAADISLELVTAAFNRGEFGEGNAVILHQNELFFSSCVDKVVYQIAAQNEEAQSSYQRLKTMINANQGGVQLANPETCNIISKLINPEFEDRELTGNFVQRLHAILDESFELNNEFSITSKGKKIELRKHQNEAVQWLVNQLDESEYNDFLFNMATGTGKTPLMLMIALAAFAADKEKNVIIVFPTIQLVHQTLDALFSKFMPLIDHFNIPKSSIYGVCSKPLSALSANDIIHKGHLADFDKLHAKGHLYLFCSASLNAFNKIENEERKVAFKNNLSTIICDEEHKQKILINSEFITSRAADSLLFKFSATPTKENSICLGNEFQYLRHQAIEEERLTPLLVDKTLPDDCSNEDISLLLNQQIHPVGGVLKNHKGIIYTSSIAEAQKLAKYLKDSKKFEDDFVHVFHSGSKEDTEVYGKKDDEALQKFREQTQGIAIVVNMLVEGYDDDNVDYIITNRNNVSAQNLHQQVGRALRKNENNSNKVGYVILREGSEVTGAAVAEQTYYPQDKQALMQRHIDSMASAKDILIRHSLQPVVGSSVFALGSSLFASRGSNAAVSRKHISLAKPAKKVNLTASTRAKKKVNQVSPVAGSALLSNQNLNTFICDPEKKVLEKRKSNPVTQDELSDSDDETLFTGAYKRQNRGTTQSSPQAVTALLSNRNAGSNQTAFFRGGAKPCHTTASSTLSSTSIFGQNSN